MYQEILVPTDGSEAAAAAATRALDLARTFDGRVHALYVAPSPHELVPSTDEGRVELQETGQEEGRAATMDVQNTADDLDVAVAREVREGTPHLAILEYAAEIDADVVVMGAQGRRGTIPGRVGSTTERVLTGTRVPVLVVPDGAGLALPPSEYRAYDEIVVPTDGSDVAERAGEHALTLAERYGADLHVVYAVDPASHDVEQLPRSIVGLLKEGGEAAVETIAEAGRERNVPVSTALLRGRPEDTILQYATGVQADLVAMGTRGLAATDDRFLGSTTARVVRRSDVPVLAVG